jgi:hypothetical protein
LGGEKMKKIFSILCFCTLLVFMSVPATQASIYYFTVDHITGGYGTAGPYGEVELTQDGSDVDVTVTLYDGSKFIRTGAGGKENFVFNATGITLADISGAGLTAAADSIHADGAGYFQYGISFTGQGIGGSNAIAGPISFTVADATISDLVIANAAGKIFAADVISGISPYNTGVVSAVPIPAAAYLLGSGLLGLVGIRRRIKG